LYVGNFEGQFCWPIGIFLGLSKMSKTFTIDLTDVLTVVTYYLFSDNLALLVHIKTVYACTKVAQVNLRMED